MVPLPGFPCGASGAGDPLPRFATDRNVGGFPCSSTSLCLPATASRLRHGRTTAYGWVAPPYPTGTFTLQETPSLLGAITPAVSRARQPQRRRSEGCWASALVRC